MHIKNFDDVPYAPGWLLMPLALISGFIMVIFLVVAVIVQACVDAAIDLFNAVMGRKGRKFE